VSKAFLEFVEAVVVVVVVVMPWWWVGMERREWLDQRNQVRRKRRSAETMAEVLAFRWNGSFHFPFGPCFLLGSYISSDV
jgi:hypothetical protein